MVVSREVTWPSACDSVQNTYKVPITVIEAATKTFTINSRVIIGVLDGRG